MSETSISVTRTLNSPAGEVFDYLTLPANHVDLDGSGFVRSVAHGDRLQEVGQVFTMNMEGDHMGGESQTDNHVVAYGRNTVIGWATAPAGTEPPGWTWVWELAGDGTDRTEVTLTYDWSKVTDKALLKKINFPLVKESDLEDTLGKLAEALA